MKAIQISFDEELLKRLDKDEEVKKDGRSAVFRRAVLMYLRQKRRKRITEAYGRAYRAGTPPELVGWGDAGTWPEP
jgi:metal-responsive CopG/Arc/MetJ family transcriptional regulator